VFRKNDKNNSSDQKYSVAGISSYEHPQLQKLGINEVSQESAIFNNLFLLDLSDNLN
jgi:hypothetical protein